MKKVRFYVLNWLTRKLYNPITAEDILSINEDGSMSYKGKKLPAEDKLKIAEDAERFSKSIIWKFLSDDAKYHANYTMYEKSTNFDSMLFGKALLYSIDIIEQRMDDLSKLK